jgi:tetratricopeptide (TPR) repeat protein
MKARNRRRVVTIAVAGVTTLVFAWPVRAETREPAARKQARQPSAGAQKSSAGPAQKSRPTATTSARSVVKKGDRLLAASRFYEALKCYEQVAGSIPKTDPLGSHVLSSLAVAQLSLGRDEDAAESMKKLAETYPDVRSLQKARLDALLDTFKHASEHTDRAARLLAEGDSRGAIAEYEEAVEHMPYNAEFRSLLALAYRARYAKTRDEVAWRKAQQQFDLVKELDPAEYEAVKADAVKP